jgi:hypothetical protein
MMCQLLQLRSGVLVATEEQPTLDSLKRGQCKVCSIRGLVTTWKGTVNETEFTYRECNRIHSTALQVCTTKVVFHRAQHSVFLFISPLLLFLLLNFHLGHAHRYMLASLKPPFVSRNASCFKPFQTALVSSQARKMGNLSTELWINRSQEMKFLSYIMVVKCTIKSASSAITYACTSFFSFLGKGCLLNIPT